MELTVPLWPTMLPATWWDLTTTTVPSADPTKRYLPGRRPIILHVWATARTVGALWPGRVWRYHFEWQVDSKEGAAHRRPACPWSGNVNNPQTLLQGTPETLQTGALRIEAGVHLIGPSAPSRSARRLREP